MFGAKSNLKDSQKILEDKKVIIAALIVVPLITASLVLSVNLQPHNNTNTLPYGYLRSEDIKLFSSCSLGQIIVVGKLEHTINVSTLRVIGHVDVLPRLKINSLETPSQFSSVVIVGSSKELFASIVSDHNLFVRLSSLITKEKRLMIIAFADGEGSLQNFYDVWLKLLGYDQIYPRVFLVDSSISLKNKDPYRAVPLDPRIFRATAIAVSIVHTKWGVGTGIFVVENTTNPVRDIALLSCILTNTPDVVKAEDMDGNSITRMEGFRFLGYVGWKHSTLLGDQWVKTEYYYAEATSGGKTYKFYLAYNIHSQRAWAITSTTGDVKFTTITDWNTDTYPGQILWDWGPKNLVCGGTISFSISGLIGISASISYSGSLGAVYCSSDFTDPGTGTVKTYNENVGVNLPFVTYTVEPASIGVLDPTKPSGTEPMIVNHSFIANYGGVINYKVYLYDPGHNPPVSGG